MKLSIRSKLTILILGVCLAIILVIWLNTVVLFKPMYYAMTQAQLSNVLEDIVDILDEKDGVVTKDVLEELQSLPIANICVDICDENGCNIWTWEGIGDSCQLHSYYSDNNKEQTNCQRNVNTEAADEIRQKTLTEGEYSKSITDENDNRQVVRSDKTNTGDLVIVSANLVQADSAIDIVLSQLQSATFIAIVLALIISAILSNWFIRPIVTLSKATKEVGKGNYKLNIPTDKTYNDEFGQLTHDFNQMIEEIENSQQMQRELIASISHDLRTPLTIIKGYAESIRDITGKNEEVRNQQLNTIIDETDRLTDMVNSVMEYAKLNQDNYKLNIVQYNIADMCNDVVDIYQNRAAKENKTVTYEGPSEVYVMADADLIERVLHNFVSNALIHTKEGTNVTVKVRLTEKGKVKVSVIDSGSGISEEDQKHIFERYYRARKDEGKQGTGLGLAIVKTILENHGFEYGINSKLGEGSEFWFIM
jgi:signal transduction histidine kinase